MRKVFGLCHDGTAGINNCWLSLHHIRPACVCHRIQDINIIPLKHFAPSKTFWVCLSYLNMLTLNYLRSYNKVREATDTLPHFNVNLITLNSNEIYCSQLLSCPANSLSTMSCASTYLQLILMLHFVYCTSCFWKYAVYLIGKKAFF